MKISYTTKSFFKFLEKYTDLITLLFILAWTAAALSVSLNRHWQFLTGYFDFGIYDTAIWKVSQLTLPFVDHYYFGNQMKLIFADHFNPSIFLLSPLYWLTQRQEVILVAQVICVSLSAALAYHLARKILKSKIAAFSLVVAYLGFVGLQNAVITDFHESTIVLLPLMIIFWAEFNKKWIVYFISLSILLGFKESYAGLGVGLGLYVLLRNKENWIQGVGTILLSIFWGILAVKVVIPYFSGGIYSYGSVKFVSIWQYIGNFFIPTIKIKSVFYSFLTFGFLPLGSISVLPAIFENFFERFYSEIPRGWDLGMHYSATLSPLMFMGSLLFLQKIQRMNRLAKYIPYYSIFIVFIVVALHRFVLRGPLGLAYNLDFYRQNERVAYLVNIIKDTPKDKLVMTQNSLATRFTHGNVVLLRTNYQYINPDYIVLNLTPGQTGSGFHPLTFEQASELKDNLLKDSNYSLRKYADELYLFTRR